MPARDDPGTCAMTFSRDTQPRRVDGDRWATPIREGWDIRGNANGGYLRALCTRAMCAHADRPDPITITAHYLAPGKVGDAVLTAHTVKAGRQLTTVSATLSAAPAATGAAAGKPLLQVLGAFGDLSVRGSFPERIIGAPPELPPPAQCLRMLSDTVAAPSLFRNRVELLLHPDDARFAQGMPSGESRLRGWFRLADAEPMDSVALVLAADAFPPTIFNTHLPLGWAPTVELTVHVRARPAAGWLRAHFSHRFASSGFIEEDGELWDSEGTLVAQSRQLALLPRPQADPSQTRP